MLRICIPLDRVEINGISDYHGFATLVGLDVELDDASEVSWHPEHIAQGDFTGSLDSTPGGRRKQPGSGASTPKRTFSIKGAFGKNGSGQQTPPPSSPLKQSTYIDSTLPPRLAWAAHGKDEATPPGWALGEDWRQQYTFNVAVLNEQAWFAEALQSAVHASAGRKYKAGIKRPRMVMEVAGYDCLATDEEVEAQTGALSRTSTSSSEAEDEETGFANETRKAEKAALAAKVFGLREDEGIYRGCRRFIGADASQTVLYRPPSLARSRSHHHNSQIHLLLASRGVGQ
jgi:sterol 3beta-glucosyltransferase